MTEKAILFDSSLCTGCKGCQVACKCWNNLPSPIGLNENKFSGSLQNPPDLNGMTRLIITFDEREVQTQKGVQWAFGRRACMHCTDAPCATICPGGALAKDENGFVTVDDAKCVGCHYCESACPYEIPHYRSEGMREYINKCTGCPDRVAQGMAPACVTTCQPGALQFGDRDEMLALAHERVEKLQARGFADASVYGEDQLGGAHVLYVLKYGLDAYELPENPSAPATVGLTQIMKPITGAVTGLTVVGLGMMFALGTGYKRDKLVYNAETEDAISLITGDVVAHGDHEDGKSIKEHIFENRPLGLVGLDEDGKIEFGPKKDGKGGSDE